MEIWRTIQIVLRRPAVLIPALLVSIGLAGAAAALVPVHYVSKSVVVLTSPPSGGSVGSVQRSGITNPLLGFEESLHTAAGLLVQTANTPETARLLGVGKGSKTTVTVTDANGSPELFGAIGPFLLVKADSSASAAAAYNAVQRAVDEIRMDLDDRQRQLKAPEATYIVVADVVQPRPGKPDIMVKLKAVAVALVFGFVLVLALGYIAFRLRERHTRGGPDEAGGDVRADGSSRYARALPEGSPSRLPEGVQSGA